jgi:hypothetical protein
MEQAPLPFLRPVRLEPVLEAAGLQPVYSSEFPVVLNFPTGEEGFRLETGDYRMAISGVPSTRLPPCLAPPRCVASR